MPLTFLLHRIDDAELLMADASPADAAELAR
jgi:hypothetical protein